MVDPILDSTSGPAAAGGADQVTGPADKAALKGVVPPQPTGGGSKMSKLQAEHPDFWKEMMKSMGMDLCNKMKAWQERAKKAARDAAQQ